MKGLIYTCYLRVSIYDRHRRPSEKRIQKKKRKNRNKRDTDMSEDHEEPQNWLAGESDIIIEVRPL
jgi:hypothetical protein